MAGSWRTSASASSATPSPSGSPDSPAAGALVSPAPPEPPIAYLDHAATSPTRREVTEAMAPFAADRFGNASGSHRVARDARLALEDAREEIASLLGARPAEVVFTGGGTESDNLAVLGVLAAADDDPPPPPSLPPAPLRAPASLRP